MIPSRKASQIGNVNQHTRTDMSDGDLLVGHGLIESPAANGEHLCSLVSADQKFLIVRDRYAARTLAFGDVYFCHRRTPWSFCDIEWCDTQ